MNILRCIMKEEKKQVSWKRIALICTCVILSLVLIVLIFAAVFMDRLLGSINRAPDQHETLSASELQELLQQGGTISPDFTGPLFNENEITVPTEIDIKHEEHIVNILLLGQDRRGGTKNPLTDVMMLCTINKETNTVTMTSFLRDLYVKIPGHYRNDKMNVAYAVGGFKMINDTLEANFGVKVDGNVEVDFSQFAKIIDMLGGVEIELTGAEAAYLNNGWVTGVLRAGMNKLNGNDALAYARIRYIDSDFQRTNRQRNVVTAILNSFRNASVTQLTDTMTAVLGMITTDMTDAQIMKYALEFAPMLKNLNIVSQHIPVEGTYYFGGVKDQNIVDCIFIRDYDANIQLLAEVMNG